MNRIAVSSDTNPSCRVAILSLVTLKFRYPHPFDLGEVLARDGVDVDVLAPEDPLVADWNAGRGVGFVQVPQQQTRGTRRPLEILSALRLGRYDTVVATCPKSLAYALLSGLGRQHRTVYYGFEFSMPGQSNARSARLNALPRLFTVPVFQTGRERARMFARVYRPRLRPESVHCAALLQTQTAPVYNGPTLEDAFVSHFGFRPKILIAVNGGIGTPDISAAGKLIDAAFTRADDVGVVMFGPLDLIWHQRISARAATGGLYLHVGTIDGTRYDLSRAMHGCDLGWTFKQNTRSDNVNDRTYTPNKLYDYLRAGLGALVGTQRSLEFAVRAGFAVRVRADSPEEIRQTVLALAQDLHRVQRLKTRAREMFETELNYERCTRRLRAVILGQDRPT